MKEFNEFQYNICFGSTNAIYLPRFFLIDFNTTFVSVRHANKNREKSIFGFQYNICFGSTAFQKRAKWKNAGFQYNICFGSTAKMYILKTEYYNFNTTFVSVRLILINLIMFLNWLFQYNICFGSTTSRTITKKTGPRFQYNICFGSTLMSNGISIRGKYFNTTFVSVRHFFNWYRWGHYFKISIQHLFRFDFLQLVFFYLGLWFQYNICFGSTNSCKTSINFVYLFQYNICFGSTTLHIFQTSRYIDFNTTFVSVRL